MEKGNKWIRVSLKVWLDIITRNNMLKILNWCCYDLDFAPNKIDTNYRRWAAVASPHTVLYSTGQH